MIQRNDKIISSQRQNEYYSIPKEYRDVAKAMESQFYDFLIKKMRDSVPTSESKSAAKDFYSSMLDTEHAKSISNQNEGTGLQKLILDQIYPQHLRKNISQVNKNNIKQYGRIDNLRN